MDACWYDKKNDTLYLIELKNWGNNNLIEENEPNFSKDQIENKKQGIYEYRVRNLIEKSIDSTCMFLSILLGKKQGYKIQLCAPFRISNATKIILLTIVNWTDKDSTYIANINSAYKSKFNPYAKLFDIKTFLVITKNKATELFEWIQ
jgi:hypothetical protein